eukprot:4540571-Pyramimonas_sp.AAC.1
MRSQAFVNGSQRTLIQLVQSRLSSPSAPACAPAAPASWARRSIKLTRKSSVIGTTPLSQH